MQVKTIYFLFVSVSFICFSCSKKSTNPNSEEILPDSSTVGVIAYCYQPLQNGIHQIYTINTDGSDNTKIIDASIGLNHHDWSPDGQKIACVGYIGANNATWSIHTFDVDGTNLIRLTTVSDVWDSEPAWSPDGTKIAFTRIYPNQNMHEELWIMDADGNNQAFVGVEGFSAKWSSDGNRFIYSSKISGNYDIYTCRKDGTDIKQITNTATNEWFPIWSPNDSLIAFNAYTGDYNTSELYIMDANGNNLTRLTDNNVSDGYPRFSPDGLLLSYTHDLSSQQWEIHIMNIDGSDVKRVTYSPTGITAINAVWQPI